METSTDLRDSMSRMRLPADELAASAARTFVRTALTKRAARARTGMPAITDRLIDDAVLLVSELVTAAAVHAGYEVEVACRLDSGHDSPASAALGGAAHLGVVVEVVDRHAADGDDDRPDIRANIRDYGQQLVRALAQAWGVTYRHTEEVMWFRLETPLETGRPPGTARPAARQDTGPRHDGPPADRRSRTAEWADHGGQSFLAEASELLAGQLDEDMVAAVTGQLLVPRLADWCAVWLATDSGRMRLSRVWHLDERRIGALRRSLEKDRPPPAMLSTTGVPWPWPEEADGTGAGGSALLFPLVAGGRCHGALLIGRGGLPQMTEGVRLAEDVARRVAQAVITARHYTRQAAISHSLQRRQLPTSLADIPGIDTAIVYEPYGEGQTVGGDFYDLFPMGDPDDRRWCFLLGDVCGHDLEAMSVTGLARHLVRLLAREGHGVESLLARLNLAMAEESAEAVAIGGEQVGSRFLSLLYGELEPDPVSGGARCTIASAGHPLPLRLSADGVVTPAADPQMLLGIDDRAEFHANSFHLAPGETLLCVTDGVTERRRGDRLLDDNDGLAEVLRGCVGLGPKAVADRVRRAAHDFSPEPIDDDLAILVLEAVPTLAPARSAP